MGMYMTACNPNISVIHVKNDNGGRFHNPLFFRTCMSVLLLGYSALSIAADLDCTNVGRFNAPQEINELKKLSKRNPCVSLALSRHYYNNSELELALRYATLSASSDYKVAQYELALLYMVEDTEVTDYKLALKWLRKSASQEYVLAQSLLARTLLEGSVVKKDVGEGLQWLARAYKNGSAEASVMIERITKTE